MRAATLVTVGALLGLAGLVIWREARGAAAPAPAFAGELVRLEEIFAGALGPRMSPAGLAELKRWEGFRAEAYRDQAGHLTVGYGHKVKAGESFSRLSQSEAEALLAADVAEAEGAVAQLVTVPLTAGQFDALVSFTFNVGRAALAESTLLARVNALDYAGAADEFTRWNKVRVAGQLVASDGLAARRAAEAARFTA